MNARRAGSAANAPSWPQGRFRSPINAKARANGEWDAARSIVEGWERSGTWAKVDPIPQAVPPTDNTPERITLEQATQAFLDRISTKGFESVTVSKYRTFMKQLRAFTDGKGYLYIDQLTIIDMDGFYASWQDGKRTKARRLHKLTGFVDFGVKRKWLNEDIAADLEPPEGHSIPTNKSPFTDEEIDRILAACDEIGESRKPGPGYREWTGEDVKDFIYVLLYTGMRISDVATFHTSLRLNGNEIFLRMHKTKKELYTWVPDWLVNRLRARQRTHGPRVFALSKSQSLPVQTERWRLKLQKVFELAGRFGGLNRWMQHHLIGGGDYETRQTVRDFRGAEG